MAKKVKATKSTTIKVFLASASDAKDLLEIAKKEIKMLDDIYPKLSIKAYDWMATAIPAMGNPETEILKQMPIEQADLFIEIFRFKYGEPTNNNNPKTQKPFQSGMEEEFFYAYEFWKENKRPEIIVFKSEEAIPRQIALKYNQVVATERFFKEFSAFGSHPGLYNTYSSVEEFTQKFRKNLISKVIKLIEENLPENYEYYKRNEANGLKEIFFDADNDDRNDVKRQEIASTLTLRLQAKSCFSFISRGALYHSCIRKALDRGMKFKIIMLNPWSLNALYSALNANDFHDKKKYEQYLRHELSAGEIIDIYENCHWKKARFQISLDGYRELKNEYKRKIDLRVSDKDLSDSIFLSDGYLLFEPYFNTAELEKRDISLFEVQISKDSDLYKETSIFFDMQWKSSYTFDEFMKNEQKFKDRLELYLQISNEVKK